MVTPSELAVTLATISAAHDGGPHGDGWVRAHVVRDRLVSLGFQVSTQQAASWLGRMCRADMPWVEHREAFGAREYRVTVYGRTDVHNRFCGLTARTPWLPTYRAGGDRA